MASLHGPAGLAQDDATAGEGIWRAPLLCPALAVTAGIVLDRLLALPLALSLLIGAAGLAGFFLMRFEARQRLSLVYLHLAFLAVGAAAHQCLCDQHAEDDILLLAERVPRPVRLRGVVVEEPKRLPAPVESQPLRSQPRPATASTILQATHLAEGPGERAVSGQIRLLAPGKPNQPHDELLTGLHPGDEVEAVGRLVRLGRPGNPGEFDPARYWADRGVGVLLRTNPGGAGVKRLRQGWQRSPRAWLPVLRDRAHAVFQRELPDDPTAQGLARALLLSEGAPMTNEDWARYKRTGVIHVLAISGQHLVVVAIFLWWLLRRAGVRQRQGAILVGLILLGYALLTGGRPPALRAAVVACGVCLALVLRRPVLHANLFALAWLVVVLVDPSSAFEPGCQLSFLSVAILAHVCTPLFRPRDDGLDRLIDESRPAWLGWLCRRGREVWQSYAVCAIVCVLITPLVAYHFGMVVPAALLLGPPLTLLTSIALLLGFVTLALAAVGLPAFLASKPMAWCLWGCEGLVRLAEKVPEPWPVHFHVGEIPLWWIAVFYLAFFAVCARPSISWRWLTPGAAGWLCVLLLSGAAPRSDTSLRCTFLDVGHGGCTVLELPDGRVVLYDAGAIGGPEVSERVIAPFLWRRDLHRIDVIILSHADLDHYNGLVGLVDRFAVGRVLLAESFEAKKNVPLEHTLQTLKRRGVVTEYIAAGDRLSGGGVVLDVLHPPPRWLGRTANENSVVVEVRHADNLLLLTGDIEGAGLATLLQQPPRKVDILQAPHHGSRRIDVESLMRWARPRLVVSCQGQPAGRAPPRYEREGTAFWTTWQHGAIMVTSSTSGLKVSGHRRGELELPGPVP
jgi:competence protein ComEC